MKNVFAVFALGFILLNPLAASADDNFSLDADLSLLDNRSLLKCLQEAKKDKEAVLKECRELPEDLRADCEAFAEENHEDDVVACYEAEAGR